MEAWRRARAISTAVAAPHDDDGRIVLATFTPLRAGRRSCARTRGGDDAGDRGAQRPTSANGGDEHGRGRGGADESDYAVQSDQLVVKAEREPVRWCGRGSSSAPPGTCYISPEGGAAVRRCCRISAARTQGFAARRGRGVSIDEQDLRVSDFAVPEHWWRGFGGWTTSATREATAAVFARSIRKPCCRHSLQARVNEPVCTRRR